MTTNYPVVFEQEDNGAISGYVPGLPLYVAADTRARAERAMRELLESVLRRARRARAESDDPD